MRFLKSVTVPTNVKGGTLRNFSTSIVLQEIETNEGVIQNVSKSLIVPKKSGAMWGFLVCFQGSGRLFCFFFRFGHFEVGVVEV